MKLRTPLGCHFRDRIPLSWIHLARGWQVGSDPRVRVLMLVSGNSMPDQLPVDGPASQLDVPVYNFKHFYGSI